MLTFSKRQAQAPLLFDRQALIYDIEEHLQTRFPAVTGGMLRGQLWALINESIRLALFFRISDVEHIRFFCALRWEFGPGFYRQPPIWAVLTNFDLDEPARMEALGDDSLEAAWQTAQATRDPQHWLDRPETLAS